MIYFLNKYHNFLRKNVKETMKLNNILLLIGLTAGIIIFIIWQNNHIVTTYIPYINPGLPGPFDGYKIIHISDLHNKSFGKGQNYILSKIKKTSPDIIFITGDLIDRRKYDLETAMVFIKGAMEIAPVYYVPGNHEAWSGKYNIIRQELIDAGVEVLEDSMVKLNKGGHAIDILGILDPGFYHNNTLPYNHIEGADSSRFQILLSHRPELFDLYVREKIDLIFAGHVHGGQIRLPFIGGLVAPDQGLIPKYTSGSYRMGDSTLIVSRGLGNSLFPIRVFNRPEIIVVRLSKEG